MNKIKIYKVGGAVRDSFLGLESKDVDYCVVADSYETMRNELISRGAKIYLEKPEFFTIRCKLEPFGDSDFVLARKDGFYGDGRRPDDVQIGSLYDDISRRDFTVNALAIDVENNSLIDYFGGLNDIKTKTLKTVGKTEDRFNEDSLRILRAIRFAITKGFAVDSGIRNALENPNVVSKLSNVSEERVREELYKMFKHDTWLTLSFLNHYGCIRHVLKEKFPNLWLKPTSEKK